MEKTSTNQARKLEIEKAAMSATGILKQEEWFIKGAEWSDKNPSYISSEKQDEQKPQRMISAEAKEALYDKPTDEEMKELLRTEYEKGRADTIAEMKSSWSEEDERICRNIVNDIANDKSICKYEISKRICDEQINWLKSLKDRVIPQPKQEWSEEDEYTLNETIQHLEELIRIDKTKHCACDVQYYQRDIDWLKSLRPQNTWKPSEEQLNNILDVLSFDNCTPKRRELLESLYEQLKKL